MILLQREMAAGLDRPKSGRAIWPSLQRAIELEHATIPVYLYALYSLDRSKNAEIAAILESVVNEEMLHMVLAANVLNALGGSPRIDSPHFIPSYPGPLPGGVESSLIVNLAPFSQTQLQTFIDIEQPEDPLKFPVRLAAAPEEETAITIGQFYTKISQAIAKVGNDAFYRPAPHNQVGPDIVPKSVIVTDVATAQRAIQIIIEQGEGTSTSPREVDGHAYAHYYRYMQVQKGKRLVPQPPPVNYAYAGLPIPFDPSGVYAIPTNPKSASYPQGSPQWLANNNFNYTYTSLLIALHALLNGDDTQKQFNVALGLMMSLKGQAMAMTSGIPNPKLFVGPSFEYQPVNP